MLTHKIKTLAESATLSLLQEDQPTGLGEYVKLPELASRVSQQGQEAYVDHRDLISQALMERILLFTDSSMDTTSADGQPESMEEDDGDAMLSLDGYLMPHDGESGPPSLGSLSLSSSQPTSLSQQPQSFSAGTGKNQGDRERDD